MKSNKSGDSHGGIAIKRLPGLRKAFLSVKEIAKESTRKNYAMEMSIDRTT